jgi:hypothetical protein
MIVAGIGSTIWAGVNSHTLHLQYALAVGALAAVTSRMTVKFPGINGTMSVNMPFLLIAVVNLSALEAVAICLRLYPGAVLAETRRQIQARADAL